jgi:Fe-Mn family superoxide dismutase
MEAKAFYALPQLSYGYEQLQPYISKEQLTLHHQKHHQAYVNGANAILERLDKARKEGADFDVKATLYKCLPHVYHPHGY